MSHSQLLRHTVAVHRTSAVHLLVEHTDCLLQLHCTDLFRLVAHMDSLGRSPRNSAMRAISKRQAASKHGERRYASFVGVRLSGHELSRLEETDKLTAILTANVDRAPNLRWSSLWAVIRMQINGS